MMKLVIILFILKLYARVTMINYNIRLQVIGKM